MGGFPWLIKCVFHKEKCNWLNAVDTVYEKHILSFSKKWSFLSEFDLVELVNLTVLASDLMEYFLTKYEFSICNFSINYKLILLVRLQPTGYFTLDLQDACLDKWADHPNLNLRSKFLPCSMLQLETSENMVWRKGDHLAWGSRLISWSNCIFLQLKLLFNIDSIIKLSCCFFYQCNTLLKWWKRQTGF